MKQLIRHAAALMSTVILAASLSGACADREQGQKMEQCTGRIYTLRTAILYPLIDSFPSLIVFSTDAQVVDGTPEADILVYWVDGG